jgi:hypothetical protein
MFVELAFIVDHYIIHADGSAAGRDHRHVG